jgi:hypothetical protein
MGGIGITIKGGPSTHLTHLPQRVVDQIASKLGISAIGKAALAEGTMDLPEGVEVEITRLSNADPLTNSLTIRKLPGGAGYRLRYGNTMTEDVPL